MTAQQLKNSILQMAVQGKLVPQDPNDEPASVLLERIKAEKQALIKAGKIKKEKPLPPITEEEIPFEIPEDWEWCRLSDLGVTQTGNTPSKSNPANFGNYIPFIGPGDISDGVIDYNNHGLSEQGKELGRVCSQYSIIQVCIGGSIGKAAITDREITFNQQLNTITAILCDYKYLYYSMISDYFVSFIKANAGGTATPIINRGLWDKILIPVPPLAEQHRIVSKIEELLPYIEKYGKAEEQLTALNTTFPEALKKSILQEAVQGKLVPQNPDDEPASVLLERIRTEKQALIKAGKIKNDKHESVIVTRDKIPYEIIGGNERCIADEVPFELPDSWCWCKMGICLDVRDGTHDTPKYVPKGIPLVTSKNLCNGSIDFSTAKFISLEDHEAISQRSKVDTDDIMFAMIGSIGNPVLYRGNEVFSIKNMALFKKIENGLDMEYVYWFLYISQGNMKKYASGGVQSFVSLSYLRNYYIPIPPLSEQKRIVAKIEELMQYCEKL